MNYVCTYITEEKMDNLTKVFIPTLRKHGFSGKIIVYGFGLSTESLEKLLDMNIIVDMNEKLDDARDLGKYRFQVHKNFINTLKRGDIFAFFDGADIIFQHNLDFLFDEIDDKIGFVTVDRCTLASDKIFFNWSKRFLGRSSLHEYMWNQIKHKRVSNVAMLVGKRDVFMRFIDTWVWFNHSINTVYFWGINVISLNYLIHCYGRFLIELDNKWCYDYTHVEPTREKGIFKNFAGKKVFVAHLNLRDNLYNKEFLNEEEK